MKTAGENAGGQDTIGAEPIRRRVEGKQNGEGASPAD